MARPTQEQTTGGLRRTRRRSFRRGDDGQSLIIVLVMSLIILSVVGVAIQVSVVDGAATGSYVNTVQSRLAAETGINATLAGLASATTPANLVSTLSYTAPSKPLWRYVATLTYATATGTALTVPLSVWPATTEITSVGSMKNGASVKMVEDAVITAPTTTTTTLLPAFNYAVFTPGNININSSASINVGTAGLSADVVAGAGTSCTNGVSIQGNVYSYATAALDLNSGCSITGGLFASSGVALSGGATVGGSVTSYGTGGIAMNGGGSIGGNATSTGANIALAGGSPSIRGNAYAFGTITWNSAPVSGSNGSGLISGITQPGDTALSTQTIAPEPAFPVITDPTQAAWATAGYTNYIVVTAASVTTNGVVDATNNCSTYFTTQYLAANGYAASASPFSLAVNGATTPTVIDASACANPNFNQGTISQTFALQTNVAFLTNGLSLSTSSTWASSSGTSHDLSIIVPAPETGDLYFTSTTTFATSLSTFMYTEGSLQANTTPSINGQIMVQGSAGQYGGSSIDLTNAYALTFSNAAGTTIPGATTQTVTGTGTPVVTGVRRFTTR
jgi:hypothetical protein